MRRGLDIRILILALGLACSGGGGGGSAGAAGGSGGSGGDGCEGDDCPCYPSCNSGEVCSKQQCFPAYTLSFESCPEMSGLKVALRLDVQPFTGQPSLEASQLVLSADYTGLVSSTDVSISPAADAANVFAIDMDLTRYARRYDPPLPSTVCVHTSDSNADVCCTTTIDTSKP